MIADFGVISFLFCYITKIIKKLEVFSGVAQAGLPIKRTARIITTGAAQM
jgi:hypothetical protein